MISTGTTAITAAAIITWYSLEDSCTRNFRPMGRVRNSVELVMIRGH